MTQTYISRFRTGKLAPSVWLTLMRKTAATMLGVAMLDGPCAPIRPDVLRAAAEATRGKADHLLAVLDSTHSWLRGSGVLGTVSAWR